MFFQHGDEHGEPIGVDAGGAALRGAEESRRRQRLNLRQQAARAEHGRAHHRARPRRRVGVQHVRDLGHLHQSRLGHLKQTDLERGAEAILQTSDDPPSVVLIALKRQHHVDEMLQQLGSG